MRFLKLRFAYIRWMERRTDRYDEYFRRFRDQIYEYHRYRHDNTRYWFELAWLHFKIGLYVLVGPMKWWGRRSVTYQSRLRRVASLYGRTTVRGYPIDRWKHLRAINEPKENR